MYLSSEFELEHSYYLPLCLFLYLIMVTLFIPRNLWGGAQLRILTLGTKFLYPVLLMLVDDASHISVKCFP